jgi:hypothetical protein
MDGIHLLAKLHRLIYAIAWVEVWESKDLQNSRNEFVANFSETCRRSRRKMKHVGDEVNPPRNGRVRLYTRTFDGILRFHNLGNSSTLVHVEIDDLRGEGITIPLMSLRSTKIVMQLCEGSSSRLYGLRQPHTKQSASAAAGVHRM